MSRLKSSDVKANFIQRRYAVNLGRRYVLAAASVVFFSVMGYPQVNNTTSAVAETKLSSTEYPLQNKSNDLF
ncbi:MULTISPECIES: hypothetical protein [unclassified Anabaena]|uniref:hypothetical protein n=1 Tax=unclassified Anabaena TaxID=2619674 RepID=UPI00082BC1D5|nr:MULTISPECIES: hypothetical protein [unclassified Anabaena]